MHTSFNILSLAIWIPVAFGLLLLLAGRQQNAQVSRWIALLGAALGMLVTVPLFTSFDNSTAAMQFVEHVAWIPRFNVFYHLGVDGLSVLYVPLTAFITFIVVLAGWEVVEDRPHMYYGAFLILSGLMIGVFSALDGVLFYVFFEATLIPMYIIIGVWGGPRRVYAAFKFFLYTLAGSLLLLIALVYLYYKSGGSFSILDWHALPLSQVSQTWLFFGFMAAFAVKVPMWPVHTWLPDVHVEAPTGGSIILAAIMLKLGCYGFVRFMLPITPDASHAFAPFVIGLSLVGVIYIGLVAMVQQDMKKLVAYSSVAHMGFVTLGFFINNELGIVGGLMQMHTHGLVSGAMFLSIGILYDRVHSRQIGDYGGVVNTMPKFAAFVLLFAMANCGLPGTAGFVGEWLVILGAVQYDFLIGGLSALALIFGAAYTLWMYKRVYLGDIGNDNVRALKDINAREFLVLTILAVAILWMGIQPKPMTDAMEVSVHELLKHVSQSKLN